MMARKSISVGVLAVLMAVSAAVGIIVLTASHAATVEHFVAPTGKSTGDGSINNPWDLQTALNQPTSVKAGDTIWLRGGTYVGNFTSKLTGTAGAPITVRSYTGEWAVIDANTGVRKSIFTINGAYTNYWGIEFTDSSPVRVSAQTGSHPTDVQREATAIDVFGPSVKVINCIVHDLGNGIGFWQQAVDSEVTGSLFYNNGWWAPDRGHGHNIYTQNQNGTKLIRDNVFFDSFDGYSIHAYGTDQAFLTGFNFDGNVDFNGGWLVGGGTPAGRLTLSNNLVYGSGFKLAYDNNQNQDATLVGNYVYAITPLDADWWQSVTANNNTFVGKDAQSGANVSLYARPDGTSHYSFAGNTYYRGRSGTLQNFYTRLADGTTGVYYTWPQWQAAGYDTTGTFVSNSNVNGTTRPTGIKTFVRPNAYEPGRALITAFNWDNADSVTFNLAGIGLKAGQSFEIRDAQNFFGAPVVKGTFSGGNVSVPMTSTQIAAYVGTSPQAFAHTPKEFGSFIVIPGSQPTVAVTPPPASGSTTSKSGVVTSKTGTASSTGSTDSASDQSAVSETDGAPPAAPADTTPQTEAQKIVAATRKVPAAGWAAAGASLLLLTGLGIWQGRRLWPKHLVHQLASQSSPPTAPSLPTTLNHSPSQTFYPENWSSTTAEAQPTDNDQNNAA